MTGTDGAMTYVNDRVKDLTGTVGPMTLVSVTTDDDEITEEDRLARERFLLLVDQLREELGARGSEAKVMAQLHLSQSYLAKLRSDPTRRFGPRAMLTVLKTLRLRRDFFEDPRLGPEPSWRDYLEQRAGGERRMETEEEMMTSALRAFLSSFDADDPRRPTPEETEHLRGLSFRELLLPTGTVTSESYSAELVRYRRRRRVGVEGAEINAPAATDVASWTTRRRDKN